MELTTPASLGEWLAFLTALATFLIGAFILLAPRTFMGWIGLGAARADTGGVSEVRSANGGFWMGLGAAALLLGQPLIYLALGFAFAGMVVARLVAMAVDRRATIAIACATVCEAASALCAAAWPLGWIS